MRLDVWNILINILLLMFWFKIWNRDDRDSFFNQHLSPLNRFANASINFLKPVFFGFSNTMICVAAFIFIIVFRAVVFSGISWRPETSEWTLYLARFANNVAVPGNLVSYIAFSLISFLIFIFKIWSISLLYISKGSGSGSGHTGTALYHMSHPFTLARVELRPFCLLAFGISIQLALNFTGFAKAHPWPALHDPHYIARILIVAFAGWAEILIIIEQMIIFLIIGSWIAMLTSSYEMMRLCREWLDFFLGPMRRYPIRIGMLDISPIIFIFLLEAIYKAIMLVLYGSYMRLI